MITPPVWSETRFVTGRPLAWEASFEPAYHQMWAERPALPKIEPCESSTNRQYMSRACQQLLLMVLQNKADSRKQE